MKKSITLKIVFCLFIFLNNGKIATAQAPAKQWDFRFGGGGNDVLHFLQQTTDGGYILGGFSHSGISGDKTQALQGGNDYWIVKTDAVGTKLWDASFGGSNDDILSVILQTTDGGYILGGTSASGISGDKTEASRGNDDYWIVKTDAAGVKLWDKRFGGSGGDVLVDVRQTSDGGYILGGHSSSGISGDKTQASQGGRDYWMVKTDGSGVKQWDYRFGGSGTNSLTAIQQTSDGGYILGGYSSSGANGDKTQPSQGGNDYWIVKTDAAGIKQWDKRFGGNNTDRLQSLQQTTDGGYILGGFSLSGMSGDKSQASQGGDDYWMVKTDAAGIMQWDARFGGSLDDNLSSVQQTADGGYILGGTSNSGISGDKTQASQGSTDYWIVKTDASGLTQWDVRCGGIDDDQIFVTWQTIDGGYILGGVSNSGLSGDKTQTSRGGNDYWIVKFEGTALAVPTLSQWGLIALGGLVVLMGMVFVRRMI